MTYLFPRRGRDQDQTCQLRRMWGRSLAFIVTVGALVLTTTGSSGQTGARSPASARPDPADARGVITGHVFDEGSGDPIPWVDVHDTSGPHLEFTNDEGAFTIGNVKPGVHLLEFLRIGYGRVTHEVTVVAADTIDLTIRMEPKPIEIDESLVEGRHAGPFIEEADRAVALSGRELASKLGGTIASTLADEPGLAERTMGPAPARPVVRGLGGERVLVLEDGAATGDLSSTSADHAVIIDPLGAREIEIVRGPAALAFGSSVIGGVVNVDRGYVPTARLDRIRGRAQVQGESVSRSRATQVELGVPWEDYVARASISLRGAEDVDTPVGEIGNTDINMWNGALGVTHFGDYGFVGAAASYFDTEYGIPGGFLGGHPNGADIRADRRHATVSGEFLPDWSGVNSLEWHGTYSRYFQEELESNGTCGVSFGLINYSANARLNLEDDAPSVLGDGSAGLSYQYRDYASACLSFTPPVKENSFGAFLYQHRTRGAWEVGGALRFDYRDLEPAYADTNKAGAIQPRSFDGWSGSLSLARNLGSDWKVESVLSRSHRSPALEELFSDGPHLAAFAFEVGNAVLEPETGYSAEASVEWKPSRAKLRVTGFFSEIDGYIQSADTGEIEYGAGESGFLSRWQFQGVDARFAGVELSAANQYDRFDVTASGSYVRGTDLERDAPLPAIPPFTGRLSGSYSWSNWRAEAAVRGASRQERVGPFETPTAAYLAGDLSLEYQLLRTWALHSVVLRLENVTDAEYRNHLSRIKSILPEAGRNVAVLYRMSF